MFSHHDHKICPHCGYPLSTGKTLTTCEECGYNFLTGEAPKPHVYLTVFGHGMCGVIAGGALGAAVALKLPPAYQLSMMVLAPPIGAIILSMITAWIGRHLAPEHLPGYERWLMALMLAAFASAGTSTFGGSHPTIMLIGGATLLLARRLLDRYLPPPHQDPKTT